MRTSLTSRLRAAARPRTAALTAAAVASMTLAEKRLAVEHGAAFIALQMVHEAIVQGFTAPKELMEGILAEA
jgi:hypothetical protein